MALAQARALLPGGSGMQVEPDDPAADAAALRALARWALRFSPIVAPDPPDGLLLDLTGCARLYGGTRRMVHQVAGGVEALGYQTRWALAPTPGGAWALARFGERSGVIITETGLPDALAPLPPAALRLSAQTVAALSTVGIDRVEHLRALPRSELAVRFGPGLTRRLDEALGLKHESVDPIQPRQVLSVDREFAGPVTQPEAVRLTVERLIDELVERLRQGQRGVRRLVLRVERHDAPPIERAVTLSRPTADARHLRALLLPVVERLDLSHGIERMTLAAPDTARLPHEQAACADWGDADDDAAFDGAALGELIDVLGARLGRERVRRCRAVETHVPERAFEFEPIDRLAGKASSNSAGVALVGADRPSVLLNRPQPAQVTSLSPDGPLLSFTWRGRSHRAVMTIGPERISARWWLVPRPTPPRDYFKVQDEAGRWWWLFRQAGGTARWFVHGRWD